MVKYRRVILFGCGAVIVIFSGFLMYVIVDQACMELTQLSCGTVIGSGVAAILSGYTLTEIFFNRKLKEAQQNQSIEKPQNDPFKSGLIWRWVRPIGTILLISVMTIVPVFVRGTFSVIFLGILLGLGLSFLYRSVANRLIPLKSERG
jgi:hypothetical protein